MTRPLVSIITPTYNHESYIGDCIESVLRQSISDWEQIIVDDGSCDGTMAVVARYQDPRIRSIQLPHRGLGALEDTYNAALATARGTFIAVVEGDDCWPADKLERQLPIFDDPEIILSWGRAALIDEDGMEFGEYSAVKTSRESVSFGREKLFAHLIRVNLFAPTASVIVRRSALDRTGGFRQTGSSLYLDLSTWLWILVMNHGRAAFLNQVLAHYRIHRSQATQRHRLQMETDHFRIVLAVTTEAPADALEVIGWNDDLRATAVFASEIAEGVGSMATKDYRRARRAFWTALHRARSGFDFGRALLGLISGTVHFDALGRAYAMRNRLLVFRSHHRIN